MNKQDREKYINIYENKFNFLTETTGLVDLIEPTLFALPDVQETIRSFSEVSELKTFAKICNYFQSAFNEMKTQNINNYSDTLGSLKHFVGRLLLKEEDLPEDISIAKHYETSSLFPREALEDSDYEEPKATSITLFPTGFSICSKNEETTCHLRSNLDSRTLSVDSIIVPFDHPSLPIEFVNTTYTIQKDGSVTKISSDSRDNKQDIDKTIF